MARGLQKAEAQRKNAADGSKTAEQRSADRKKNAADSTGQICMLCRQTFSNVAKEPMLRDHWTSKHPKETDITIAFPQLKTAGAAAVSSAATAAPAKKVAAAAAAGAAADAGKGGADKKKKAAAAAAAAIAIAAGAAPTKPKNKPVKGVEAEDEAGEVVAEPAVAETPAAQDTMQLEATSGLAPTSEPAAAASVAFELSAEEEAAANAKREKYATIAAAKKQGYAPTLQIICVAPRKRRHALQPAACTVATCSPHLHFYRYAKLEAVQHAKEEEAIADLVKAAISKGEITAITAAEFDLLRGAAASC